MSTDRDAARLALIVAGGDAGPESPTQLGIIHRNTRRAIDNVTCSGFL